MQQEDFEQMHTVFTSADLTLAKNLANQHLAGLLPWGDEIITIGDLSFQLCEEWELYVNYIYAPEEPQEVGIAIYKHGRAVWHSLTQWSNYYATAEAA